MRGKTIEKAPPAWVANDSIHCGEHGECRAEIRLIGRLVRFQEMLQLPGNWVQVANGMYACYELTGKHWRKPARVAVA